MERFEVVSNTACAALNPAEIAAIVDTAYSLGIPAANTLERTGLSSSSLFHEKCKATLQQHATAICNAVQYTGDRLLPLRAGSQIHLSAFGIIGYALWSSATLREALATAQKYAPLLNLKCGPTLAIEREDAILYFGEQRELSARERELCVEFELAKMLTILRDLHIAGFNTSAIRLPSSSAEHLVRAGIMLDCPRSAHAELAQIRFSAALLDCNLPQANARTHQACLEACDRLLADYSGQSDLATSVRSILTSASGTIPTLTEVAGILYMSARTLRRRLDLLDTSYSQLLDEVRRTLAIRYVSSTCLTTEAMAEKLGYSDAANFSHAFKRWTGQAPGQYRSRASNMTETPRDRFLRTSLASQSFSMQTSAA
ncbi:Helix-turn-helix domain-containing protein [Burkholderia sp. OK233]|nr:Helix-turn-helix domain-containing protein [Burkholderia sp. OK233]